MGMRVEVVEVLRAACGRGTILVPVGMLGVVRVVDLPAGGATIRWKGPMRLRGVGASLLQRSQWKLPRGVVSHEWALNNSTLLSVCPPLIALLRLC